MLLLPALFQYCGMGSEEPAVEFYSRHVEARVLGALVEKDVTTPDYYALSLNALVNACNQKNNRTLPWTWTKKLSAGLSSHCSRSAWPVPPAARTLVV